MPGQGRRSCTTLNASARAVWRTRGGTRMSGCAPAVKAALTRRNVLISKSIAMIHDMEEEAA